MNSRLYTGRVAHHRAASEAAGTPENSFGYQLYFLLVDLAELAELDAGLNRFAHNHFALTALHDRDHGPRDGTPLRPWIDALLAREGIDLAGGSVQLLAFPRVLGGKFFPASVWYCFHADGGPRAVLVEVQNTVGGHHNYLLHNGGAAFDWSSRPTVCKIFYVSPFIDMDGRYEFTFAPPGDSLKVGIYDYVSGPLLLTATLDLKAQPLTDKNLTDAVWRYGPMSMRAWTLILFQALRIVAKGIPYHPPLPMPDEETTTK